MSQDPAAARHFPIRRAIEFSLLATIFLYYLCCSLPWAEHFPTQPLDQSWCLGLQWAREHRLDFGRQVVFTFGPWGFILAGYTMATFAWTVFGWTCFAAAGFLPLWYVLKKTLPGLAALTAIAAVVAWLGCDGAAVIEVRLLILPILLAIIHFHIDARPITPIKTLLIVAMAWTSLTKFPIGIFSASVVLAVAADMALRRKFPAPIIIYPAAVVFFWLAADQSIASLWPYLRHSIWISGGYAQGESYPSATDVDDLLAFLACAALLLIYIALFHARPRRGWAKYAALPAVAAAAAGLGLAFKIGYVRHDFHELTGTSLLMAIAVLYLPVLWPRAGRWKGRGLLAMVMLGCVALNWRSHLRYAGAGLPREIWRPVSEFPNRLATMAGLLAGTDASRARIQSAAASLIGTSDLIANSSNATADVYPVDIRALLAAGANYHPRPILQSYLAFTPQLARINADALVSPAAPAEIYFDIAPIDLHLASEEDAPSWPELLTRYDPAGERGSFLLLRQAGTPRTWSLRPLTTVTTSFGRPIALPSSPDPIWACIDLQSTALGGIIQAAYRPPVMDIALSAPNGRTWWVFTMIPDIARAGFLLSPVIEQRGQFANLYSQDWKSRLRDQEPGQLMVVPNHGADPSLVYAPQFTVQFFALNYAHLPPK